MKKVKDSTISIIQLMTQLDANLYGNVHGGTIMKLVDNTAGLVARRHTGVNAVTASIDQLDFHTPVYLGELLRIHASINYTGNTSMEVGARVEAENVTSREVRHTASAYLTFVALDESGKPAPIEPVAFETEEEKRRNYEAGERRGNRLAKRQRNVRA